MPMLPSWFRELVAAAAACGGVAVPLEEATGRIGVAAGVVGERREAAQRLGRGDLPGADLVMECANDLLATRTFPRCASLHLVSGEGAEDGGEDLLAGALRACRAVGARVTHATWTPASICDLAVTMTGGQVAVPAPEPAAGDVLLALPAPGLQGHGLATAMALLADAGILADTTGPEGCTAQQAALAASKCYLGVNHASIRQGWLSLLAVVGHGGMRGSLRRALPAHLDAELAPDAWPMPWPWSDLVRRHPQPAALLDVLNLGVGMIIATPPDHRRDVLELLRLWNEPAFVLGSLRQGLGEVLLRGTLPALLPAPAPSPCRPD